MFREALLESSPAIRRRNAWPMASAFTLEMIIVSVLVLLPLISSGVLPPLTSAWHSPTILPAPYRAPESPRLNPTSGGSSGATFRQIEVVPVQLSGSHVTDWRLKPRGNEEPQSWQPGIGVGKDGPPSSLFTDAPVSASAPPKRVIISNYLEAMLVNKVVPEYPNIARLAGVQGDVKLHAIIAKDGTIQSLVVTSGPEMLREAALKAVEQWRYRPYMLNGQAMEVETVITVSFHRF